jgi:hypothetical protein
VALTVALQLAVLCVPALNEILATEPLAAWELAIAIGVSSLIFVAVEIEKRGDVSLDGPAWLPPPEVPEDPDHWHSVVDGASHAIIDLPQQGIGRLSSRHGVNVNRGRCRRKQNTRSPRHLKVEEPPV